MELKKIEELLILTLQQLNEIKNATDLNQAAIENLATSIRVLNQRTARIESKVEKMRPN